MRKPAATLVTTRTEAPATPRLDLQAPFVPPPPVEIRPPRPADRIKEALLRWLEEEM
jgi:hypothetical protein